MNTTISVRTTLTDSVLAEVHPNIGAALNSVLLTLLCVFAQVTRVKVRKTNVLRIYGWF